MSAFLLQKKEQVRLYGCSDSMSCSKLADDLQSDRQDSLGLMLAAMHMWAAGHKVADWQALQQGSLSDAQ